MQNEPAQASQPRVPYVVGIGGTTRPNSTSEQLMRAVLKLSERKGAATRLFSGTELARLPHYKPDLSCRSAEQTALIQAVREADAIVIATPGYHGGISGLVKNALDLLEDLREDRRPYLDGRPVGLIVTAAGWQACGITLSALRDVVHSLRGWPTPISITANSSEPIEIQADFELAPGPLRDTAALMTKQVLAHIHVT